MDDLEETIKNENAWTRKKNELITLIVVFLVICITMILESSQHTFCGSLDSNCLPRAGAFLVMVALFGGATSYYIQSLEKIATNTFLYAATLPKDPENLKDQIEVPQGVEVTDEMAKSVLESSKQLNRYKLREMLSARVFATDFAIIQFVVAAFGTFVWGFGDLVIAKIVCFIMLLALEIRIMFICWISKAKDIYLFPNKIKITSMK